jgi:hypothetical protein
LLVIRKYFIGEKKENRSCVGGTQTKMGLELMLCLYLGSCSFFLQIGTKTRLVSSWFHDSTKLFNLLIIAEYIVKMWLNFELGTFYLLIAKFFATQNIGGT